MRTGNIAGRYEIENEGIPTYVPSLFHWGTSIIMDGKFDDDKAYLFTAPSKSLVFTNGDSNAADTDGTSSLTYQGNGYWRRYYVKIPFATADAGKFSTGSAVYTADGTLNGNSANPPHVIDYTDYSGGKFNIYIYLKI